MNLTRPPKAIAPLIEMAASDHTTPAELRAALRTHDKAQLSRNGFHLIQALSSNADLAVTAMKFACLHEALASEAGIIWAPMSSRMLGSDGESHTLTDDQARRFATYVLDELAVSPFPGLIYIACRFGWAECAKLLKERGVYKPLAWTGFANDTDDDRERLVTLLLEIVQPSVEDIRLIRRAFKDGEPAAKILDQALDQEFADRLARRLK